MLKNIVTLYTGVLFVISICDSGYCENFPPPTIEKCRINDEKCLIEQTHKFIKNYAKGSKELNIQSLDPLRVEDFSILGDSKRPANINLYLNNGTLSNFLLGTIISMKGFSSDTSKPMNLQIRATNPDLEFKAKYKISGKILVLPIFGEGDAEMHTLNNKVKVTIPLIPEKRSDGKTYFNVGDVKLVSTMSSVKINLTNLFGGDKALSDNILNVINENWQLFVDDIDPPLKVAVGHSIKEFMEKLIKDVPYEDFFLENTK